MNNFDYERKYSNVTGGEIFEDGDQIKVEMREKGKPRFEFISFYWSKETYERCLKIAGFKSIKWEDSIISQEGISKLGSKYWKNYTTNPTLIGLICEK